MIFLPNGRREEKKRWIVCNVDNFLLNPSERTCNKFFNYLKLCVISFFARKMHFYNQNTLLDAFRTNSRNIIRRCPFMVMSLLANQDLMPMLARRAVAFILQMQQEHFANSKRWRWLCALYGRNPT